jgi:hypothetical protein
MATLGVMLFPGDDESDRSKAQAYAAQNLAKPLGRYNEAGHKLPYDSLLRIASAAGEQLDDLNKRWDGGLAVGELFKAFFILSYTNPNLASWNNVVRLLEKCAAKEKKSGCRSSYWAAKSRFLTVAHLWGAWSIRKGNFRVEPEVGHDGYAEYECFMAEAEQLREWGQNWRARRAKSKPPLPEEVWRMPADWRPERIQGNWPQPGMIPWMTLDDDLVRFLKQRGN